MLKLFLVLVVCVCIPFVFNFQGFLVGPGQWLVLNINTCDDPGQYEVGLIITRKKINRTHDCFDLNMDLDKDISFAYGIEIELYQEVDGGFKYHQTLTDKCVCTYFKKNAKENMERAFTLAKIHPPDCPVPRGAVTIRNFVMDYTELPELGMYGTFEARVYIMFNKQKVACVRVILNFEIRNEDENNENDVSTSAPVERLLL